MFTARKRSCDNVMFSKVSVCPRGEATIHPPNYPPGPYPPPPRQEHTPQDHTSQDHTPRSYPQLLTPSGGHHTYGRQAGSTHPTGMHSCFVIVFFFLS